MTTITIPLDASLNDFINHEVKLGHVASKADLVRKAIQKYKEDQFIQNVLSAKQEIREGKGLKGDLDVLAKGF